MRKKKEYHGDTKTDLYQRWASMVNRCKPGRFSKTYFDKEITVCDEWQIYANFKTWALDNGFSKELELDRKDNDKGYYPDNCRFITKLENNSNRSNTIFIDYKGETVSLTLFALRNSFPTNRYNTIRRRIKNGWSTEKAIETPLQEGNYGHKGKVEIINTATGDYFESVKDAALSIGVKPNTLSMRLNGHRKNKTHLKKL